MVAAALVLAACTPAPFEPPAIGSCSTPVVASGSLIVTVVDQAGAKRPGVEVTARNLERSYYGTGEYWEMRALKCTPEYRGLALVRAKTDAKGEAILQDLLTGVLEVDAGEAKQKVQLPKGDRKAITLTRSF